MDYLTELNWKIKAETINDLSAFQHVYHAVDFSQPDIYDEQPDEMNHVAQEARKRQPLEAANVISSRLLGQYADPGYQNIPMHTVMLDIDHRVRVIPSSTEGHSHLYIDVPMPWPAYLKLLEVLGEVGIIEPGYLEASRRREATHLRLPWVKKDPADAEHRAAAKAAVEEEQRRSTLQIEALAQGRILDDDSAEGFFS